MDTIWLMTHVINNQMYEQMTANLDFHAHDLHLFAGS